jgi:hypothetical protein
LPSLYSMESISKNLYLFVDLQKIDLQVDLNTPSIIFRIVVLTAPFNQTVLKISQFSGRNLYP